MSVGCSYILQIKCICWSIIYFMHLIKAWNMEKPNSRDLLHFCVALPCTVPCQKMGITRGIQLGGGGNRFKNRTVSIKSNTWTEQVTFKDSLHLRFYQQEKLSVMLGGCKYEYCVGMTTYRVGGDISIPHSIVK